MDLAGESGTRRRGERRNYNYSVIYERKINKKKECLACVCWNKDRIHMCWASCFDFMNTNPSIVPHPINIICFNFSLHFPHIYVNVVDNPLSYPKCEFTE